MEVTTSTSQLDGDLGVVEDGSWPPNARPRRSCGYTRVRPPDSVTSRGGNTNGVEEFSDQRAGKAEHAEHGVCAGVEVGDISRRRRDAGTGRTSVAADVPSGGDAPPGGSHRWGTRSWNEHRPGAELASFKAPQHLCCLIEREAVDDRSHLPLSGQLQLGAHLLTAAEDRSVDCLCLVEW